MGKLLLGGLTCLLVLIALAAGVGFMAAKGVGTEIVLPLIAIAGVVVLLAVLALVAVAFSTVSLSDRAEALGLPAGSVRAVIALSLVVLFAILSVFLFGSLNDGSSITIASCLPESKRNELLVGLGNRAGVASVQTDRMDGGVLCPDVATVRAKEKVARDAGKAAEADAAAKEALTLGNSLYRVYSRESSNAAAIDFAKQLLVLIGTLVTAVASFYFGSKATSEAQAMVAGAAGPPAPRSVTPSPANRGGPGGTWLSVTGSSLNDVRQIQLEITTPTGGTRRINGMEVVSNANKADAKFEIDKDAPTGAWDVIVTDALGRSATLKGALAIDNLPALSSVTPVSVARGTTSAPVTVAGVNLEDIKLVEFTSGGQTVKDASPKATATQVIASFAVEGGASASPWDITVTDSKGRKATLKAALTIA